MYSTQPSAISLKAARSVELMNKYGYPNAESVLDEWSYFPGNWGLMPFDAKALVDPKYVDSVAQEVQGVSGAAFDASTLILLQDSTVNIANFYHGNTTIVCGVCSMNMASRRRPITRLRAFKSLLETPGASGDGRL